MEENNATNNNPRKPVYTVNNRKEYEFENFHFIQFSVLYCMHGTNNIDIRKEKNQDLTHIIVSVDGRAVMNEFNKCNLAHVIRFYLTLIRSSAWRLLMSKHVIQNISVQNPTLLRFIDFYRW